jgi:hypothetical protein
MIFFHTNVNSFTFYPERAGEEYIYASQFMNSILDILSKLP